MSRSSLILSGSMTALATPFRDGGIDDAAFVRLCERQIARGTTALIVCGSTGEAAALRPEEQAALIRMAVETAGGLVPVIAGCGGPSTDAAATAAGLAAKCGAAALLCAPTPYVKPSQEGIIAHMRALAHVADLPLILYDVPGRAGVAIKDETVAMLFDRGLGIGLKDATADLARPARLRSLCGPDLVQLSGDDATAAAYRAAGGHGCISVTANLTASLCALLHSSWDHGDLASFARTRDLLAPLHDALFIESNPVPLKAALAMLNLAPGEVRLPLIRATEATHNKLADILARVMSLEESLATRPCYAMAG
jgi:4-hydroxy-tetrahydrodipicolinate synthase